MDWRSPDTYWIGRAKPGKVAMVGSPNLCAGYGRRKRLMQPHVKPNCVAIAQGNIAELVVGEPDAIDDDFIAHALFFHRDAEREGSPRAQVGPGDRRGSWTSGVIRERKPKPD